MYANTSDLKESEGPSSGLGETPQSVLERMIIETYLAGKNITTEDLKNLPPEEAQRLMKEACSYASMKLAEVESKAKFRREIRYEK